MRRALSKASLKAGFLAQGLQEPSEKVKVKVLVTQLCPTLCNPPSGSPVHDC